MHQNLSKTDSKVHLEENEEEMTLAEQIKLIPLKLSDYMAPLPLIEKGKYDLSP